MDIQIGSVVMTDAGVIGRVHAVTDFNAGARYYSLQVYAVFPWGLHLTAQRRFVGSSEIVVVSANEKAETAAMSSAAAIPA